MKKINWKQEWNEFQVLLRNVPAVLMTLFVISVVFMNILANKELISLKYLSLDTGFLLSWASFLTSDMLTKRFGAKAAIEMSVFAEFLNLCMAVLLFLICLLPTNWGEAYTFPESAEVANAALNHTIGGTWFVVLGSALSFLISSIANALINQAIGKRVNNSNFRGFAIRSYVSTAIGQFIDNFVFASVVSYHFFGWTATQVFFCSLVGALFELFAEVVFSPIGYEASKKWNELGVGNEYLDLIAKEN